jgi:TRAP-type C4-dicarboxylate transport system permease small subunit
MLIPAQFRQNVATPLVQFLERLTSSAMMIFLLAMMLSLFWQVFSRFVVNVPATWTEEAARYSFIYMAFLGAALGVRRSSHFGLSILTGGLRGKTRQRYYRFVINLPILIASVALLVYGTRYMLQFGFSRISPTFHFPMAWVYLVIPLSAVPMTVFAAYNVFFEDFAAREGSAVDRWAEEPS